MIKKFYSIFTIALCFTILSCKSDTKATQAEAATLKAEIEAADSTSAVLESVEKELDDQIKSTTDALNALED